MISVDVMSAGNFPLFGAEYVKELSLLSTYGSYQVIVKNVPFAERNKRQTHNL